MLADTIHIIPRSGKLDSDIHLPATAKKALVCFIVEKLPQWRDDPGRPTAYGETKLTEDLCTYLDNAAYYSEIWSHVRFQTETSDETYANRKIDLTVKPRKTIIIAGQPYCQYDMLFPIECKRLPTPTDRKRDEREYVISKFSTTGGIQRFKFGYHGAAHTFAVIIAYVQEKSCSHWQAQVNGWIQALAKESDSSWNETDILQLLTENLEIGVSTLSSKHQRTNDLKKCELYHLWVEMNKCGIS